MKYVLDSNIAIKWVLPEADSDKARILRVEFQNQIHELLAPDVFRVEIAHGLAKAERRGIIPVGDADRLLANVLATPPRFLLNVSTKSVQSWEQGQRKPSQAALRLIQVFRQDPSGLLELVGMSARNHGSHR